MMIRLLSPLILFFFIDAPANADPAPSAPAPTPTASEKASSPPSPTFVFDGPRSVIPGGPFTAEVLELQYSLRQAEFTSRIKKSMRDDPAWWSAHQKKSGPGQPLQYDPKIGLTKEEFEEFLVLSKQMSMASVGTVSVSFVDKGNDVFVLDAGEKEPDLKGIEIDLKNDVVRTPFGTTTERKAIDAKESVLGPWVGRMWRLERKDFASPTIVEFALGKMQSNGKCVIYYDVKKAGLFGKTRIWRTLQYDPPAANNEPAASPLKESK